jgi:hypothetical protein
MCAAEGRAVPATVADHVEPHKSDVNKFWLGKSQSLCTHCHESRKKFIERRGFDKAISADGYPIDPRHPVYARERTLVEENSATTAYPPLFFVPCHSQQPSDLLT